MGKIGDNPWILMGDFNAMLRLDNKRRGGSFPRRASSDFADCIQDCGLIEIKVRGPQLTWERRGISEKLD